MTMPSDPHNPYASPFSQPAALTPQSPRKSALPAFVKTMFIIDLVLSGFRTLLALLAIPGYFLLRQQHDPSASTAIPEVVTGLLIAFTAVPADILGLMRKRVAVWLGGAACVAVILSIAVGAWQASLQLDKFPAGTPQRAGFYIGLGGTLLIRLLVMAVYAAALVQFLNWCNRKRRRAPA